MAQKRRKKMKPKKQPTSRGKTSKAGVKVAWVVVESEKNFAKLDNLVEDSCHRCMHANKELARTCTRCLITKERSEFIERKRIIKQKEKI